MDVRLTTALRRMPARPAVEILAIPIALGGSWVVAALLDGAGSIAPHWFYIPIFYGGMRFGHRAALLVALAAAITAGPLLPADVNDHIPQAFSDWGTRGLFFIILGQFVTYLSARVRRSAVAAAAAVAEKKLRGDFVARLVSATEDERKRLAMELHDGPIQGLSAVTIHMARIQDLLLRGRDEAATIVLKESSIRLSSSIAALRRTMNDLRPPALDHQGLADALRDHISTIAGETAFIVDIGRDGPGDMSVEVETALYRVAQEALHNVAKHSDATVAHVKLHRAGDRVVLEVEDNGRGFDATNAVTLNSWEQFGLTSMRERVWACMGTFEITSAMGQGTSVRATVPVHAATGV